MYILHIKYFSDNFWSLCAKRLVFFLDSCFLSVTSVSLLTVFRIKSGSNVLIPSILVNLEFFSLRSSCWVYSKGSHYCWDPKDNSETQFNLYIHLDNFLPQVTSWYLPFQLWMWFCFFFFLISFPKSRILSWKLLFSLSICMWKDWNQGVGLLTLV